MSRERLVREVGPVLDALARPRAPPPSPPPRRGRGPARARPWPPPRPPPPELGLRVDLLARVGVRGARPFGGEDLDPVDALCEVGPDHLADLVRGVDAGHELEERGMAHEGLVRHARPHVVARGDHVGPGQGALPDELAEAHVEVVRDAGAARGRHSRLEGLARRGEIGEVGVGVDEARAARSGRAHSSCATPAGAAARAERLDLAVTQDEGDPGADLAVPQVHHVRVA